MKAEAALQQRFYRAVFSAAFVYALAGLVCGDLSLNTPSWPRVVWAPLSCAAAIAALLLWLKPLGGGSAADCAAGSWFTPWVMAAGLALWLSTSFVYGREVFFEGAQVRWQMAALGAAGCAWALVRPLRCMRLGGRRLALLLLILQAALAAAFWRYMGGGLIFSDDHPTFLYRLAQLREYFPHIPFYNTDWNGGYVAGEFYATGMMSVFYAAWPLWRWWPDLSLYQNAHLYSLLFPYLFIFLVPWSIWAAARVLRLSLPACFLAAMLAIAPSLGCIEWMLKFGTIGFCFCAGLFPLTAALWLRVAADDEPPAWRHIVYLLAAASLCLQWTPLVLLLLPLGLGVLLRLKVTAAAGRGNKIAVFLLLFALINGPWICTFMRVSKVASFAAASVMPGAGSGKTTQAAERAARKHTAGAVFERGMRRLREAALKGNPLLLLLLVPGLGMLAQRRQRRLMAVVVLWAFLLAAFGDELKPQLELKRMAIPAFYLMALLAGAPLVEWLKSFRAGMCAVEPGCWYRRAAAAVCFAVFAGVAAVTPLYAARGYLNRTDVQYRFAPPEVEGLSAAIARHGGAGRTFFSGFILHELGATAFDTEDGGHIAPLALFSGKELYASHFSHRFWHGVEPIPDEYLRRGEAGIEAFLDLVNATAVVTFRREWVQYCQRHYGYREVYHGGRFRLFVREHETGGWFQKGQGVVSRIQGGVRVVPASPEAVIKYRYFPELSVKARPDGVEIFPVYAFNEGLGRGESAPVYFIGIRAAPAAIARGAAVEIGMW